MNPESTLSRLVAVLRRRLADPCIITRPASLLRGAMLGFFLSLCCGLTPSVYGANTFSGTGSMSEAGERTLTLLPNGKVLAAGGYSQSEEGFPIALLNCELFDPATGQWSTAAPVPSRVGASGAGGRPATLLPNGKVLAAGGSDGTNAPNVFNLYDPITDTWSPNALFNGRFDYTSTLLRNGKVLIVAGRVPSGGITLLTSIYDPVTGIWSGGSNYHYRVVGHAATQLPDGTVLVTGGYGDDEWRFRAGIYNPNSNSWALAPNMTDRRAYHTATVLPDGRVLVAGGEQSASGALSSAVLYIPATGAWAATTAMGTPRKNHTATLLPNGKVLVAGGWNGPGTTATAEIFDPAGNGGAGSWNPAGNLAGKRQRHAATLLADGRVLIAGGRDVNYLATAEIFDSASPAWSTTGSFAAARDKTTSTLLPDGKVLVAGGVDATGHIASAEIRDPVTGTIAPTGALTAVRSGHSATLLPGGKVLVAGGVGVTGALATAELYNPATGTWAATGSLAVGHASHTATLLPDGKVLVAGGLNNSGSNPIATAEIYDPATGLWSTTGSMIAARNFQTATLLPNGKVLVAGGGGAGVYLAGVELFDPANGVWTATGALTTARAYHTATLLPNGRVLAAGGQAATGFLSSAELYNPATGFWTNTGALSVARRSPGAILLPNGTVMVTGGDNGTALDSSEIYGLPGFWRTASPLPAPRYGHNATLLPSGKILLSGGRGPAGPLATAELYDFGLGYPVASRAQISTVGFDVLGRLVLTGTGLRSDLSTSGGNGSQDSPANYPLVQIRRLDNEQSATVWTDSDQGFTGNGFIAKKPLPINAAGHLLITVTVNGIPSPSAIFSFAGVPAVSLFAVEKPSGQGPIANGGTYFGLIASVTAAETVPASATLTIRNTGDVPLTAFTITIDGPDASLFSVTANPVTPLPPGGTAPFTVRFASTTPGTKSAVLRIAAPGSVPFTINLVGQVAAPAIVVERPGGVAIPNGGSVTRTTSLDTPLNLSFTIRNPGAGMALTGLVITKGGAHPGEFTITTNPTAPVPAGGGSSTTFTVRVGTGSAGTRSTVLHIASNAYGNNPFDINLAVQVLSNAADGDGDGLSDGAEFDMAALGFDWQVAQPALANGFLAAAGMAGLYNVSQFPALRIAPSLARNPVSGTSRLTIGVQKSTDPTNFSDFPMNGAGRTAVINGQGKLEFEFTDPGNIEFFTLPGQ